MPTTNRDINDSYTSKQFEKVEEWRLMTGFLNLYDVCEHKNSGKSESPGAFG